MPFGTLKNTAAVLLLLIFAFNANPSMAEDSDKINIYPLKGVFSAKNINNPRFSKLLKTNRQEFIETFENTFKKYYPDAEDKISEQNKYKTFVAYVHFPRVSEDRFKKSNSVIELYLPMTASINFVNALTSEQLYSYPYTHYAKYETTPQILNSKAGNDKINELYVKTYETLIEDLIAESAREFHPFDIEASIADKYKNLYVLDKGLTSGIAKGDMLTDKENNQISVIYSSLDYSIAQVLLGTASCGNKFHKFANSSLAQLKKPKILFINDFNSEKFYNIFASALGQGAAFSLSTVDATFYDMQEALVSLNSGFRAANTNNREVPDYFLKLFLSKPLYTKYPAERNFASLDRYSLLACGIIFDKSGRVVFSKCADDDIRDEVISDAKFSNEARFDVLIKNTLNKLAASFVKEVEFKNFQLPVKENKGGMIFAEDKNGFLRAGNSVLVYKKVKSENKKSIIVPTWEYKVLDKDGSKVQLAPVSSFLDNPSHPSKGDLIIIDTILKSNSKTSLYNYAPVDIAMKENEIKLKSFKNIAFAALAASMKSPISTDKEDFRIQVDELNSGYGFKRKLEVPETKNDLTIKAVYKIKLLNKEPYKNLLKNTYEITVGIVAKNSGKNIQTDGLVQEVSITVPKDDNEDIIEYELMKYIYPLIEKMAAKF